jgi:hypothetical protein
MHTERAAAGQLRRLVDDGLEVDRIAVKAVDRVQRRRTARRVVGLAFDMDRQFDIHHRKLHRRSAAVNAPTGRNST